MVKRVSEIRVVHEHLVAAYEQRGFESKVKVESPFLPPEEGRREAIIEGYSGDVRAFIDNVHTFRIATSAWKYVNYTDQSDLYGISDYIALVEMLSGDDDSIAWLLAVGEYNSQEWPADLVSRIEKLRAEKKLVLMVGQQEFWPVYARLDLFLRLTATDGNSVSVLEALFYGCPVIASDVVPRPLGVISYKYSDSHDLQSKIASLIRP